MSRKKGNLYIHSENYKKLCKQQKLTRADVAAACGVEENTLAHYVCISNQRPVPPDVAKKIAECLNVDVQHITRFAEYPGISNADALMVANDDIKGQQRMIGNILRRNGRKPLFDCDDPELTAYKEEYYYLLVQSVLDTHDRFCKLADIADRFTRHSRCISEIQE